MTDRLADLERLQRLREQGALDDEEFAREKTRLMAASAEPAAAPWYRGWPLLAAILALAVIGGAVAFALSLRTSDPAPTALPTRRAAVVPVATPTALPAGERLAAAVAATFPRGVALSDDDGERFTFTTHRLIDAPFGPVLVSEGQGVDPAHVTAGRLDIAYLRAEGPGFVVVRRYPAAVRIGSFGRMSEWSASDRFADVPTLVAEGGFTGQGYTCGAAALTELRPTGPAEVASIRTLYDDSGASVDEPATTIEGKIAAIERGRGFEVRYTGTRRFTDRWVRRGDGYALAAPSQLPEC